MPAPFFVPATPQYGAPPRWTSLSDISNRSRRQPSGRASRANSFPGSRRKKTCAVSGWPCASILIWWPGKRISGGSAPTCCAGTAPPAAAVVIEVQLGPSDHSHLGQLLTYAVRLPACAVWLATAFHKEHLEVIEKLNRLGGGAFRCFAVEMRLWKIAGSPVAPKFFPSSPNPATRLPPPTGRSPTGSPGPTRRGLLRAPLAARHPTTTRSGSTGGAAA